MQKHLKKILIKTKKSVFSQKLGNNSSKFKGEGYDFTELREYEDGEDVRKIDWVISAKIGKPYVKVFHAQRELDITIVPLLSGSTVFGTDISKQNIITQISALIGYSCVAQGDSCSGFIANKSCESIMKKTKNIHAIEKMVQKIYQYNPIGKDIDYNIVSQELFQKIRKKSLVFLVGDFLDYEGLNLKLLGKKHEVVALVVRDRFEENPQPLGNVNLLDPSTMESFEGVLSKQAVQEYTKRIKLQDKILMKNLRQWGVEFSKIYTDDNVIAKMMKVFQ